MSKNEKTVRRLKEEGVKFVYGAYVDINGVPKSKCVPINHFDAMADGSETYTVGALAGMGPLGPNEDECKGIPDLSSITILPWDKRYAVCVADLEWRSKPYSHDSRAVLKRQISLAAAAGFKVNVGIEPEFYVLREVAGKLEPLCPDDLLSPLSRGYDIEATIAADNFLAPVHDYINQLGWDVYSIVHEGGNGQFEINFRYADALVTADRMLILRLLLKHVAKTIGCFVSFMPKPFGNDYGSGAHINMSLADAVSGENIFELDNGQYSKIALSFTAGLIKYSGAITALACPSVNSYKRLEPYGLMRDMSWAPIYRAYGHNNRTLMCRLPMSRRCVELRHADSLNNVYLTIAMAIAAGLSGIRENLDAGEPIDLDTYIQSNMTILESKGISRLPKTLDQALDEFENSELARSVMGDEFHRTFIDFKSQEVKEYSLNISEWEREKYLRML